MKRGWGGVFLSVQDTARAAEDARWQKLQDRFWTKVDIVRNDECWNWTATLTGNGYGQFNVEGRPFKSHRVAYELSVGSIPEGKVLDHLCRNRACVNPAHLEPVTQRQNILRGDLEVSRQAVIRYWRERTHCKNNHELTAENVYAAPGRPNSRACRACRREATRRSEQKRKAS